MGLIVVEAGSPLVTRAQLDETAHDAADTAALQLLQTSDVEQARQAAFEVVTRKEATLKDFAVDGAGGVRVTVEREARSLLLHRWDRTEGWYDVEVSATAKGES